MNRVFLVLLTVLTSLVPLVMCPAQAQTFQIQAQGTLYDVGNRENLFDSSVAVGVPFTYTANFDFRARDRSPNDPANGQYELYGTSYGAVLKVGNYTIHPSVLTNVTLFVEPNPRGTTNYTVEQQTQGETVSSTNPNSPAVTVSVVSLILFFKHPSPILSKAIPPLSVYDVNLIDQSAYNEPLDFNFYGPGDPNQYDDHAVGHITSLTATMLPPVYSPQYAITDLGTLGGETSMGYGINASGQVTGRADVDFSSALGFIYSAGHLNSIGGLPGAHFSQGYGINDSGQVTGVAGTPQYADHAFLYSSGALTDLGTLGGPNSQGMGINAAGQIAGASDVTAGQHSPHAFLYSGGHMTNLGTLGGSTSEGLGINASGQVTGDAQTGSSETHAFVYSGGHMADLGTFGGTYSVGYGINSAGAVTGTATIAYNLQAFPFLDSGGMMTNLGTLGGGSGQGYSVNASGQVVGRSDMGTNDASGNGIQHAFLYDAGYLSDLNFLVASGSGWTLTTATGINDTGSICGYGLNAQGQQHAFLLTPLPPLKPLVSSLSPSSKPAGSGAFTLTVNGTNFVSNSVVKWNGAEQPTTFVSSTQLTAAIPAALITTASTANITVVTPHVATSGTKTFTVTLNFTAAHVGAAPNGSTSLLWNSASGAAFVQTVQANGTATRSATFGPYAGASAKAVAVAPDGSLRLLWTNTNGTAGVWSLTAAGAVTSYGQTFGPYAGSTATGMTVTSDGKTRLLWTTTAGAAQVWTLDTIGRVVAYSPTFGPYSGGAHVSAIGGGGDGKIRLLWTNSMNAASAWLLDSTAYVVSYGQTYGPYTGASAVAVGGGADGKSRLLWTNTSGAASVWTLSSTGSVLSYGTTYGPYTGAGAYDLSVDADNVTRLLWTNAAGQAQVWSVSPTGGLTYSPNLGPF